MIHRQYNDSNYETETQYRCFLSRNVAKEVEYDLQGSFPVLVQLVLQRGVTDRFFKESLSVIYSAVFSV